MELRCGWQPLRHGAAVPSLLAHWSSYYEQNARRPEVVQLAPWVARLYEKRLARRRIAAALQSGVGEEGMGSTDAEDAAFSGANTEEESGESLA